MRKARVPSCLQEMLGPRAVAEDEEEGEEEWPLIPRARALQGQMASKGTQGRTASVAKQHLTSSSSMKSPLFPPLKQLIPVCASVMGDSLL